MYCAEKSTFLKRLILMCSLICDLNKIYYVGQVCENVQMFVYVFSTYVCMHA